MAFAAYKRNDEESSCPMSAHQKRGNASLKASRGIKAGEVHFRAVLLKLPVGGNGTQPLWNEGLLHMWQRVK